MRRLRHLAALLAPLLLGACAKVMPPDTIELTYASPYSPSHPFSRADITWMHFVEQQSGGRLRIRPIWNGALLSADMSMTELRYGVADIGSVTPIYARGKVQLIRIQSGFYSGAHTIADQLALYRCLAATSPELQAEMAGLKVLALQGGSLPGIVTRSRPVRSLADLRGLRLRAPTELLTVLRDLGADPVNMPMGEVYSALAKGVIDGVVAPADTFKGLHFGEVAHYFSTLQVPRGAYPSRAISERRWNALPPAARQVLQQSISIWEAALAHEIDQAAAEGFAAARASHVTISAMPRQDQVRFDALYLRDAERNAASLTRYGIDGLSVFRAARKAVTPHGIVCEGK